MLFVGAGLYNAVVPPFFPPFPSYSPSSTLHFQTRITDPGLPFDMLARSFWACSRLDKSLVAWLIWIPSLRNRLLLLYQPCMRHEARQVAFLA